MADRIKRVYQVQVLVDGAKDEFQKGLGVGVLMKAEVTFNCTQAEYDSPRFALALLDKQKELMAEVVKTTAIQIS
jgi:hypothetical protein